MTLPGSFDHDKAAEGAVWDKGCEGCHGCVPFNFSTLRGIPHSGLIVGGLIRQRK